MSDDLTTIKVGAMLAAMMICAETDDTGADLDVWSFPPGVTPQEVARHLVNKVRSTDALIVASDGVRMMEHFRRGGQLGKPAEPDAQTYQGPATP